MFLMWVKIAQTFFDRPANLSLAESKVAFLNCDAWVGSEHSPFGAFLPGPPQVT
jgi:hypothetical protein